MGIFITHNLWVWILSSCQAAVCLPGDSCYWDLIPDFPKCHRDKRGMLAHSGINCSLELITFWKTTWICIISEDYSLPSQCFTLKPYKNYIKNDFEPAQSYFLLLIFIGSSLVSLSYKLDSVSYKSIFNSKQVLLAQCYSNKSLTGIRTPFYKVQRQREKDKQIKLKCQPRARAGNALVPTLKINK